MLEIESTRSCKNGNEAISGATSGPFVSCCTDIERAQPCNVFAAVGRVYHFLAIQAIQYW